MAATFEVIGNEIKVTFTYQAPTARVIDIVGDASEYLFDQGYGDHGDDEDPIYYADLSNQDKLDIVDVHVRRVILGVANTFKSVAAQKEAREAAADDEYSF